MIWSCSKDEDNLPYAPIDPTEKYTKVGMMMDASDIVGIDIEDIRGIKKSYADVKIRWGVADDALQVAPKYSSEEWDSYVRYCNDRTAFIQEDFMRYQQKYPNVEDNYQFPIFYSAYLTDDITITCDKKLFGKESGENLAQYFELTQKIVRALPIGIYSPKLLYSFFDEQPRRLDKIFVKDAWLPSNINIYGYFDIVLNATPEEKYDSITFTITMPIYKEYLTEYIKANLTGAPVDLRTTKEEYSASCTINFDWSE